MSLRVVITVLLFILLIKVSFFEIEKYEAPICIRCNCPPMQFHVPLLHHSFLVGGYLAAELAQLKVG